MPGEDGIREIVVGVDGSEHSEAALEWAVRMARGMGSKVTAVHALYVPMYFPQPYGVPVQFDEEWRKAMRDEFEGNWCRALKTSGVEYRALMEDGRPASVISSVAERMDADVIVVGRRGRSAIGELLLGSVSHELAIHSKRPVLIVEPKARSPR